MQSTHRYELGVGALMVAAAVLLGFMAIRIGAVRDIGDNIHVEAVFRDVSGLKDGAAVTVAGVDVGRVDGMAVDFDRARVGLIIETEAGIRQDVLVRIRARSVLGEKYVELVPQTPDSPLLADKAVLTNTESAVEIDQLVNQMGPLFSAVDPDDVSQLLAALVEIAKEDPERARRMTEDAERLLHNAALASDEAPALMTEARSTLADARDATAELRVLVRKGGPVLDRADAVLVDLEDAAAELPAATERLPGLIADAEATLAEAQEVVLVLSGNKARIEHILANVEEIDKWELRRLLREEGIKVRLRTQEVVPDDG